MGRTPELQSQHRNGNPSLGETRRPENPSPRDGWLLQQQVQDTVLLFLFSFLESGAGKYNVSP